MGGDQEQPEALEDDHHRFLENVPGQPGKEWGKGEGLQGCGVQGVLEERDGGAEEIRWEDDVGGGSLVWR